MERSWKSLHFFYNHQDMIQSIDKSNNTIIQICTESMQKPENEILKSIAPKPSVLWSWKFNTSYIMKLPTTLVLTIFIEKHHLHHETNCTTKTVPAVYTAEAYHIHLLFSCYKLTCSWHTCYSKQPIIAHTNSYEKHHRTITT